MNDSATRILLVEDSRFLRKATELILVKAGYEVVTAGDGDEAYAFAHAKQPHLIILDMMMPKRDGLSTLRSLKEDSSTTQIPVIVLTGLSQNNEDKLLRAGALAYYEKSKLIPETLVEIVQNSLAKQGAQADHGKLMPSDTAECLTVEQVCPTCGKTNTKDSEYEHQLFEQVVTLNNELIQAQNALSKAYEELQTVSRQDHLTGLANRKRGMEECAKLLALSRRQGLPVCVAMVDIDYFKKINDTHGHASGDRVLARFGRIMAEGFRTEDVVARWGGEEFFVAMYNCSPEDGLSRLDKIKEQFSRERFSTEKNNAFQVTFSAGIAVFPDDSDSLEGLSVAADRALYSAKKHGRNRIFTAPRNPKFIEEPASVTTMS